MFSSSCLSCRFLALLYFLFALTRPELLAVKKLFSAGRFRNPHPQESASSALPPELGAHRPELGGRGGHGHVDAPHEAGARVHGVRLLPAAHRRGEDGRM